MQPSSSPTTSGLQRSKKGYDQGGAYNDICSLAPHPRAEDTRLPSTGLGLARPLVGERLVDTMLTVDSSRGGSEPRRGIVAHHLRLMADQQQRRGVVCRNGR